MCIFYTKYTYAGDVRSLSIPTLNPRLKGKFQFLILGIMIVVLLNNLFLTYIRPNKFGIKVVRIGLHRGVYKEVYQAGLHFVLPFGFQQMHRLPKDIQVLGLTGYRKNAAYSARKEKAAHIQTSDGFFVDVDVSILYKIVDPYKVFTKIGPGNLFEDNGIISKAEPVLKAALGELTTEEFYKNYNEVTLQAVTHLHMGSKK